MRLKPQCPKCRSPFANYEDHDSYQSWICCRRSCNYRWKVYKPVTRRSGVMLCYPFDERRLERWGFPVLVQPKINGVRCRTVLSIDGTPLLHSSEANQITSVPHILDEVTCLHAMTPALLDGELYAHLTPLGDITSITSRTVNIHPNHELMEYGVALC